ncbi:MAG: GAF domain-containing protein [Acidobacteria bacterium]|nr:GAF domain-containing protein [Acidobacteriota bacterium]
MPSPGGAANADVLARLQAVVDAALAHLSLDDLLDELLARVRDALDADTCAVLLLDEKGTELVARAAKGIEEEVEQGVRIPVGGGFAGRIAATRGPVVIEDVDHSYVLNPILREKGIKSLLGVPLLVEDRMLGVVHVGTLVPRMFTDDDIALLQVVAQRVALAIDRALTHQRGLRQRCTNGATIFRARPSSSSKTHCTNRRIGCVASSNSSSTSRGSTRSTSTSNHAESRSDAASRTSSRRPPRNPRTLSRSTCRTPSMSSSIRRRSSASSQTSSEMRCATANLRSS